MRAWIKTALRYDGFPVYLHERTQEVAFEDYQSGKLIALPASVEPSYRLLAEEELQGKYRSVSAVAEG